MQEMNIATIAIIGAGGLGRAWACRALRAGYRTVLEDVSISALEQAAAAIQGTSAVGAARLLTALSVEEAVRDADLILETVADELEMKLELFTIFDKFAKPGAIFASTTNAFSITDLGEMTVCPERCIGMRFALNGGEEWVTLLRGRQTSDETVARCSDVASCMGVAVRLAADRAAGSAGAS